MSTLSSSDLRRRLDARLAELTHAEKTLVSESASVLEQRRRVKIATKAQHAVQLVAQSVQKKAHRQIADIVTRCLQTVFGRAHEFKILFERKRGKTEARLVFMKDGEEENPKHGAGIGRMDVAAFALRLSCLLLQTPKRRRLMVLDEPFRCLSKRHRPAMVELLETLADELDFQFVMVTHDEEFEIGKVVKI